MFTGIVEKTGKIVNIEQENTNFHFTIEVDFAHELKIDQSMAHDGCCLTIVKLDVAKKSVCGYCHGRNHAKNQFIVVVCGLRG